MRTPLCSASQPLTFAQLRKYSERCDALERLDQLNFTFRSMEFEFSPMQRPRRELVLQNKKKDSSCSLNLWTRREEKEGCEWRVLFIYHCQLLPRCCCCCCWRTCYFWSRAAADTQRDRVPAAAAAGDECRKMSHFIANRRFAFLSFSPPVIILHLCGGEHLCQKFTTRSINPKRVCAAGLIY